MNNDLAIIKLPAGIHSPLDSRLQLVIASSLLSIPPHTTVMVSTVIDAAVNPRVTLGKGIDLLHGLILFSETSKTVLWTIGSPNI